MSEDEARELDRLLGITIHPEPDDASSPEPEEEPESRMSLIDTFYYLCGEVDWMSPEDIEARLREAV